MNDEYRLEATNLLIEELHAIIQYQRGMIEEYKTIIVDKNQVLDEWFKKYQNLASETGWLRTQVSAKSSVEQQE